MSISTALKRARKALIKLEKKKSTNANQLFVCTEYNKELTGELVIILAPNKE